MKKFKINGKIVLANSIKDACNIYIRKINDSKKYIAMNEVIDGNYREQYSFAKDGHSLSSSGKWTSAYLFNNPQDALNKAKEMALGWDKDKKVKIFVRTIDVTDDDLKELYDSKIKDKNSFTDFRLIKKYNYDNKTYYLYKGTYNNKPNVYVFSSEEPDEREFYNYGISGTILYSDAEVKDFIKKLSIKDSKIKYKGVIRNAKAVYKLSDFGKIIYVVEGNFDNDNNKVYVVTYNYKGENDYLGGGEVTSSLSEAIKTANNYKTMDYLNNKYGENEGYRRWMRGETDSSIKDADGIYAFGWNKGVMTNELIPESGDRGLIKLDARSQQNHKQWAIDWAKKHGFKGVSIGYLSTNDPDDKKAQAIMPLVRL